MNLTIHDLPTEYHTAYHRIKLLAQHPRYLGACIFGSVAKNHATPSSDLDVKVVIDQDNPCGNINHPLLNSTF